VDLEEHTLGSRALRACGKCGGVWLDAVACRLIMDRAPATASFLFLADRSAEQATVQPEESTALCPECRAPMNRTPVPSVEATIDTCSHGTWFDARELRIFAHSLNKPILHPSDVARPLEPERPATSSFDDDGFDGEALADFIGAVLGFVASLFDDDHHHQG
jgi:Zn-finger nucleic acid-binding protein